MYLIYYFDAKQQQRCGYSYMLEQQLYGMSISKADKRQMSDQLMELGVARDCQAAHSISVGLPRWLER